MAKLLFLCMIAAGALVFLLSHKRYKEFLEPLDKKTYPLKEFLPIGLYLLEITGYKYSTGYDKSLLTRLAEIAGTKYARFYRTIHWANTLVFFLFGLAFAVLVTAASGPDAGVLLFDLSLLGGILLSSDRELEKRIKKRRAAIQMDFPDFLNKLALLINAGMTMSRAVGKIADENRRQGPLYKELEWVMADIRAGKGEYRAYEDFAKRCRTPEITRVISVVLQNLRKGSSELVPVLRVLSNECWEMRKNTARKLGEEASTKMLLPLMLMFLAMLLIVVTPAALALRGI